MDRGVDGVFAAGRDECLVHDAERGAAESRGQHGVYGDGAGGGGDGGRREPDGVGAGQLQLDVDGGGACVQPEQRLCYPSNHSSDSQY
ncbi:MAG: hypothetical protein ACK55I_02445, partial [bacterium]